MFSFLEEYASEFILVLGIAFLKLFGREQTAEKLKKKFAKKRKKLEKKVGREVTKVDKDMSKLEKLGKE